MFKWDFLQNLPSKSDFVFTKYDHLVYHYLLDFSDALLSLKVNPRGHYAILSNDCRDNTSFKKIRREGNEAASI